MLTARLFDEHGLPGAQQIPDRKGAAGEGQRGLPHLLRPANQRCAGGIGAWVESRELQGDVQRPPAGEWRCRACCSAPDLGELLLGDACNYTVESCVTSLRALLPPNVVITRSLVLLFATAPILAWILLLLA